MKQIISPKIKKARARKEKFERFKLSLYSRKVIRYLSKQYKKTGQTIIALDPYKFKEDKLLKVLELLQREKQLSYKKDDDIFIVNIILKADIQKQIEAVQKNIQEEPKPEVINLKQAQKQKRDEDDEVLKF